MKLTLKNLLGQFGSIDLLNSNFSDIETELQDKVLYRDNPDGEPNQMENDLDMNSNDILNTNQINTDQLVLDGKTVTPDTTLEDIGSADVTTSTGTQELETALDDEQRLNYSVDSVDTLRASSFPANLERLWLSGYYGAGTLGGGQLYADREDTTSSDNNGTVFIDADDVRWKREERFVYSPTDFGAKPNDNTVDDTQAFVDALDNGTGIIVGGGDYRLDSTVVIDNEKQVVFAGDQTSVRRLSANTANTDPVFSVEGNRAVLRCNGGLVFSQNNAPEGIITGGKRSFSQEISATNWKIIDVRISLGADGIGIVVPGGSGNDFINYFGTIETIDVFGGNWALKLEGGQSNGHHIGNFFGDRQDTGFIDLQNSLENRFVSCQSHSREGTGSFTCLNLDNATRNIFSNMQFEPGGGSSTNGIDYNENSSGNIIQANINVAGFSALNNDTTNNIFMGGPGMDTVTSPEVNCDLLRFGPERTARNKSVKAELADNGSVDLDLGSSSFQAGILIVRAYVSGTLESDAYVFVTDSTPDINTTSLGSANNGVATLDYSLSSPSSGTIRLTNTSGSGGREYTMTVVSSS